MRRLTQQAHHLRTCSRRLAKGAGQISPQSTDPIGSSASKARGNGGPGKAANARGPRGAYTTGGTCRRGPAILCDPLPGLPDRPMHEYSSTVFRRLVLFGFASALLLPMATLRAQKTGIRERLDGAPIPADEDFTFLRLARNEDDEPVALEAAIVRYVPADGKQDGLVVDLVSAVHVADDAFFTDLNKRFQSYDAVLYELVAPEGTRVPKGGIERDSLVSMMQGGMTHVLGLTFQLDEVDYTRKNFVHADMTPEEFSRSMKDRGETMLGIFFRMMAQGLSQQARDPTGADDIKLLAALFSANREHELKVFMAEQFAEMDAMMDVFGGKDGSTLVTERNKKALSVLKRQIKKGRRHLAVFYGAAHMRDMDQKLQDEFGLRRESVVWVSAWDLSQGLAKKKARQKGAK
jgi:hypothetical protein